MVAVTSAEAAGLALIAATTCAAVLASAPVAFVARLTTMSLPVTTTLSGASAAPGLRSSIDRLLPPSWPQAVDVTFIAEATPGPVRVPTWPE